MRKLHFPALTPQNSEALRLTVVQSTFWASMAIGGYQTVYLQNNGFPAAQFGLLNAIACAVAIVAMTFWGMVSDRIGGVRKIMMLTLTLGVSLFALIPLIPTGQPYSALLFLIVIPIVNFFRSPMSAFVDNLTVRNCAENGLNYGTIRSSGSLWFAIAGILAVNLLIPAFGVSSTFFVAAIVMVPTILLAFFCREPQSGGRARKSRMGAGKLFKDRRFVAFLIFGFFFYVGTAFESNFLPYLMTSINIDSTNVGLVLSVRALMEIPFLFFIVKLRRRFQLRYLIMLAAAFMGVECLLLGLFVTTLPEFVVFAAVFGFGNGLFIGTATNYIYELAPVELRATAHGLFVSVSQIAGILGNLLGGFLFDAVGGKPFYLIACGLMFLSILVFAVSFIKKGENAPAAENN